MHRGMDECQWKGRCKVGDVLSIAYLQALRVLIRL